MKRGNIDKWEDITGCTNLLFFSQLVNELLFDYSIPSNRIATLNSHFLCVDALSAIDSIEHKGVPEGTLKPIMEELYETLQKDPVFETENSPLKYFVKYQNDKYRISTNVSELGYEELKKAAVAINTSYFTNNMYYEKLRKQIVELVEKNAIDDQPKLFRLIKSLLTELINLGYSTKYIYNSMDKLLWNPTSKVTSSTMIRDFFDVFDFKRKKFMVVFVVNKRKIQKFINYVDGLSLTDTLEQKTTRHIEKNFLNRDSKYAFLQIEREALDQYKASEAAKDLLDANISFYRLCDHNFRYELSSAKCGVYSEDDFFIVDREVSGVSHTKTPSSKQIVESSAMAEKALDSVVNHRSFDDCMALIHAARFHTHSLDAMSSENQLLDLWAIFEAILDISNKHTSDRINQICMYLIPILKRRYIYSLFLQLSNDMKNYSEEKYKTIIGDADVEEVVVQKICEFVVLAEKEEDRKQYLDDCEDFPLLKERIEYYSQALAKPVLVYQFVEKHAERVKWQIMRIYRNRNLIIHNGDSMPYLDLLIENLHSYVDDFLSYVIHSLSKGNNVNSMCQMLFAKECEWVSDFSNRKIEMSSEVINKVLSM